MPSELDSNMERDILKEKKKDMVFNVKYIGESSRSLYERSCEHKSDFENLSEKSHILKHYLTYHKDIKREELEFGIRVRKKFQKAFERQVGEAIAIEQEQLKGTLLLNSKSEFNRCSVPRLTLGSYKENIEEMKEEEKQKKKLKDEIRMLKKRKTEEEGNLRELCDEMLKENYIPWKKRRIEEEMKREKENRKEEENWQRTLR